MQIPYNIPENYYYIDTYQPESIFTITKHPEFILYRDTAVDSIYLNMD